jgi:hypothetical protein
MSASLLLYVISLEMLYVSLTPIIRYQSRDVICQPHSYYTLSVWRCYMSASLLLYVISLEMLYVILTPIILIGVRLTYNISRLITYNRSEADI